MIGWRRGRDRPSPAGCGAPRARHDDGAVRLRYPCRCRPAWSALWHGRGAGAEMATRRQAQ
ncbi:DUF2690 domain-containing protein [Streptomyces sp. NPDC048392]|uniref:DUF2690 domain-containing protein n=1 Tax=Streptomyces sp. NPDC048392 TaxID=3365543 RepID=UPI00371FC286